MNPAYRMKSDQPLLRQQKFSYVVSCPYNLYLQSHLVYQNEQQKAIYYLDHLNSCHSHHPK